MGKATGRFCVAASWSWFKYLSYIGKLEIDRTWFIYIEGMNKMSIVHCLRI